MDLHSRKDKGCCLQFLNLIPKTEQEETSHDEHSSEYLCTDLELSLRPPGEKSQKITSRSDPFNQNSNNPYAKNPVFKYSWQSQEEISIPVMKQTSQSCDSRSGPPLDMHFVETKPFLPPPLQNTQKRNAPGPVVGWPPVRSSRKNLTTESTSKSPPPESENARTDKERKLQEDSETNKLVKINMDGIPIGRKVDLKTHDSYDKLSHAIDKLFRGFVAAQSNTSKEEGDKAIECSLDGCGEYTLVYEDNEGNNMLVGDVLWSEFVSTVKRLRVLKSSGIPILSRTENRSFDASLRKRAAHGS